MSRFEDHLQYLSPTDLSAASAAFEKAVAYLDALEVDPTQRAFLADEVARAIIRRALEGSCSADDLKCAGLARLSDGPRGNMIPLWFRRGAGVT